MKSIVTILLLFSSYVHGQRLHGRTLFDGWTTLNRFKVEDSLEGLYTNDTLLKIVTDTLPLYALDASWRDMKLVTYFYDSSNTLRKVAYRDGQAGYFYFYFEGSVLRKARFLKDGDLKNLKYYFTREDNSYTVSEIELRATQDPEKKDAYETLKMGKVFFEKFKTLL